MNDPLLGVVMCGGKSSRMGADKGLIPCASNTWAGIALRKIQNIGLSGYISINSRQISSYSDFFPGEKFIIDSVSDRGPVGGLDAIAGRFPGHAALILACDLPLISKESLIRLVEIYNNSKKSVIYRSQRGVEPLCAIYDASFLKMLHQSMDWTGHSPGIQTLIQKYKADFQIVDFPQERADEIKNYNTAADAEGLKEMCAQEDSNLRPFDS